MTIQLLDKKTELNALCCYLYSKLCWQVCEANQQGDVYKLSHIKKPVHRMNELVICQHSKTFCHISYVLADHSQLKLV